MLKKLLILVILVLASVPAFAQTVDTAWVRRYNGTGNSNDLVSAIATDASGNVYVTGWSAGSGTADDYATIKYRPNGDTAWVRRYDGLGGNDRAYAIAVNDSGNVYVTGTREGSGFSSDYATIKYYPNGDTAWVRRYNAGYTYGEASAIALDGSGNIYVTGFSNNVRGNADYATVKYYPNGDTAWARTYDGPVHVNDYASAIAVDGYGNVYVTGYRGQDSSYYNFDYTTVKYNASGTELWARPYNGPGDSSDVPYGIALDTSGNVYVTGYSIGSGTGEDYATIKYYPNGVTAWVRRYDGPVSGSDYADAIAVDNSGNIYVTGSSFGFGTLTDFATIKYYPNGDTAWVRRYNGPGNGYDGAKAIAVDGSGNIYVTGGDVDFVTGEDYATIKYKPNGDTVWVRRYAGPGGNTDEARVIAVGKHGNVYVTGWTIGTDLDYLTIKYSPKSGPDTLRFMAYSPVDLIVTDPVLDSIGVDFNTILNGSAYYTVNDHDSVVIPNPIMGEYMVRVVPEPGGSGSYTLAVKLDGNEDRVMVANAACPGPGEVDTVFYNVPEYLHGDVNRDGKKTVSDVVFLINYLFKAGPAPDPVDLGDCNFCEQNPPVQPGQPTVSDVVSLVNYLFKAGEAPCS